MKSNNFFNLMLPYALNQNIILPSIPLAQAALETGFGKYTKRNNYFGIKSNKTQPHFISKTNEYINSNKVQTICRFKKYNSISDSFSDYLNLIQKERYRKVVLASNYMEGCKALYICGYATDPNYASKLISIIEKYSLSLWDDKLSSWAIKARLYVINNKISDGTRAKEFATREEIWTMLMRQQNKLN